ncbi:hypothetical protein JCM18750_11340 [Halostagnicola bangensis]
MQEIASDHDCRRLMGLEKRLETGDAVARILEWHLDSRGGSFSQMQIGGDECVRLRDEN